MLSFLQWLWINTSEDLMWSVEIYVKTMLSAFEWEKFYEDSSREGNRKADCLGSWLLVKHVWLREER